MTIQQIEDIYSENVINASLKIILPSCRLCNKKKRGLSTISNKRLCTSSGFLIRHRHHFQNSQLFAVHAKKRDSQLSFCSI